MSHPGALLKANKLYAGKELGQNFIVNPQVAEKIVEQTGIGGNDIILEIGSGLGALTIAAAKKTKKVFAVEKDRRLIRIIEKELEKEKIINVTVINKDFLRIDIEALFKGKKLVILGNLPYNISSQILIKLIENRRFIEMAFLMFQKELAHRISALPGSRDYSRLSVVAQYCSQISPVIDIGPQNFFPKPEVDSRIIKFSFFEVPDFTEDQEIFLFKVIKAAFSKRRKTLKNSLHGTELSLNKDQIKTALAGSDIYPERRAETLSVDEFKTLAQTMWNLYGGKK